MITEYPYQSKEWWKEYRKRNLEKLRAYARDYNRKRYKTHYESEKARRIRWASKNPEKVKAHQAVRYQLKSGKIIKLPCYICSRSDIRIIAHHDDYQKPLDIIWLCEIHHKARHEQNKSNP